MAEWLRRSPAKRTTVQVGKRLGSARVSSNLILVEFFLICPALQRTWVDTLWNLLSPTRRD